METTQSHTARPLLRRSIPRNPREALKQAGESCHTWNSLYPVGTRVRVYRLLGIESSAVDTVTTSQAWVMGGHSAMVMVRGLSGGYALTHVRPLMAQHTSSQGERAGAFSLEQEIAAEIAAELESGVAV